jgi:hypothetical protein
VSDDPMGQAPAGGGEEPRNGLDALADEVLPALIARLRASRLGELEVRSDGWRVRLRRDVSASRNRPATPGSGHDLGDISDELARGLAHSPAVGYFDPGPGLVVGNVVQGGDPLGSVDVLGVGQEVYAPCDGIISEVLVDAGQAVEYGQALAEVDPLDAEIIDSDATSPEAR